MAKETFFSTIWYVRIRKDPILRITKRKKNWIVFLSKECLIEKYAYCASYFSPDLTVYRPLFYDNDTVSWKKKNHLFLLKGNTAMVARIEKGDKWHKMTNSFKPQHYFIRKVFILTFLFQLFCSWLRHSKRGLLNIFSLFCVLSALKNSSFITCDNFLHKYLHTVTIKLQYLILWWWCK